MQYCFWNISCSHIHCTLFEFNQIHFTGTPVRVSSARCSCPAGITLCHHTVAVLYLLQHYQKLNLKSVPAAASKTSLPQVNNLILDLPFLRSAWLCQALSAKPILNGKGVRQSQGRPATYTFTRYPIYHVIWGSFGALISKLLVTLFLCQADLGLWGS